MVQQDHYATGVTPGLMQAPRQQVQASIRMASAPSLVVLVSARLLCSHTGKWEHQEHPYTDRCGPGIG